MNKIFALSLVAAAILTGCSTLAPNAMLDQARADYRVAQDTPQTRDLAGGELKQAGDALNQANDAWTRGDKPEQVSHLAYLARQRVAIAQESGQKKGAELSIANAEGTRDKVRLAARTEEADKAHQTAAVATRQAQAATRDAEAATRDAEASSRAAESARRMSVAALQQTSDVQDRNRLLEAQLQAMNAKKTDRGYVITIGDLFFDTDKAEFKSGGQRSVANLVAYLKEVPGRKVLIEGYTDSTGSAAHNQDLSSRRAGAVRAALVEQGVAWDRAEIHGFGEAYPVAGNDSAGGRQLNRRVEILLSDDNGKIISR